MGEILEKRRNDTNSRFVQLQSELAEAEKLVTDKACVYVTGSFGRGEASRFSDLDLFIVGRGEKDNRDLSPLDEICVKADLIKATRKLNIPEFSGGGEYLVHYTEQELIESIGKRDDDANNTLTARLLLLLESKPLVGSKIYESIIADVLAPYWKDYEGHRNDFTPTFLANDILRLWRTFCVNYEARTSSEPAEKRAKRRLKNYKLKHSRLLTCYSGLLYLLAAFAGEKTVRRENAVEMTQLTPTARLEWIIGREHLATAHNTVRELLDHYEKFLEAMDISEAEQIKLFLNSEKHQELSDSAGKLGDLTFHAIELIGQGSKLHRILLV